MASGRSPAVLTGDRLALDLIARGDAPLALPDADPLLDTLAASRGRDVPKVTAR